MGGGIKLCAKLQPLRMNWWWRSQASSVLLMVATETTAKEHHLDDNALNRHLNTSRGWRRNKWFKETGQNNGYEIVVLGTGVSGLIPPVSSCHVDSAIRNGFHFIGYEIVPGNQSEGVSIRKDSSAICTIQFRVFTFQQFYCRAPILTCFEELRPTQCQLHWKGN